LTLRKVAVKTSRVSKFGLDDEDGNDTDCCEMKVEKLTNMIIAGFRERERLSC